MAAILGRRFSFRGGGDFFKGSCSRICSCLPMNSRTRFATQSCGETAGSRKDTPLLRTLRLPVENEMTVSAFLLIVLLAGVSLLLARFDPRCAGMLDFALVLAILLWRVVPGIATGLDWAVMLMFLVAGTCFCLKRRLEPIESPCKSRA